LFRVCRQDDGKIVGVGGTQESLLVMRIDGDGSFDGGFGDDGVVQLPWGVATSGVQVGYGCAIQDDGKIVLAARVLGSYQGLTSVGVVVRLLEDGELDPAFNDTGYVMTPAPSNLLSVALQPDGKIVAGGYARLMRLLSDGTPDPDFGTAGVSTAANQLVQDLVIQPDGAIVTVGQRNLARFDASGDPDPSFGGGDGVVTVPGLQSYDALYGVTLQGDMILAAGAITVAGNTQGYWIGRYDATGTLDTSFGGGDGMITGDAEAGGTTFGVSIDGEDRIVGAGFLQLGGTAGRSARFDADGDPDPEFGTGGVGQLYNSVLFSNAALEPDGSFTVAGAGFGTTTTFAPVFARTSSTGGSGGFGEVNRDVGGSFDRAHAVAFQADGKVLIGGWAYGGAGPGLARLEEDGDLDPTFGDGGVLTATQDLYYVNAIAAQGSRILVSGLSGFGGDTRELAVVAYDDGGVLDESFGIGGVARGGPFAGLDATGLNMAVGADGSIAVVGQTTTEGGPTEYAVLRLTADGDPDPDFDGDGAAASGFGSGYRIASHAAIQGDGGVLVFGQSGNGPALIRFDATGAVDAAFGTVVPPTSTGMLPFGMAVQPDGKIVLVMGNFTTGAMQVVRYAASGAIDGDFGVAGVVARTFGGNDYYGLYSFMGLTVLDDGTLVIGLAAATDGGLRQDGLLLRLDSDGAPDEDFGPDGVMELSIGRGSTSVNALGVDAEGRLLAVGRTWTASGGSQFMALRFLP
jgi:uncharacterized delta-60 repeat protein